jgi:hypothetical protein
MFPRPDMIHIAQLAPLALPLLAFCISRMTQSWRPADRYAAAGRSSRFVCLPSGLFRGVPSSCLLLDRVDAARRREAF